MSFHQNMPTFIRHRGAIATAAFCVRAIRPIIGIQLVLLTLFFAGPLLASSGSDEICDAGAGSPQLHLDTSVGSVVIELFESAAPKSLRQLLTLIEETVPTGYFEDALFDYASPHRELRLTAKAGTSQASIDLQLDASALGLDKDEIASAGHAMDVLQREILAAFAKNGKKVEPGSKLEAWLQTWYQTRDAKFLVGTSRQTINEALGYRYETGLESRPVTRGMVALRPDSPNHASPSLSFLLCDMPERDGRWMVIGEVIEGLEILEAIALRPLAPGMVGHKFRRPAKPIEVRAVHKVCSNRAASTPQPSQSFARPSE